MPKMHHVDSTSIEAIGYESATRELYVRFIKSRTYVYFDVEERVFNEFMQADSKGQYLNSNIRGAYVYQRR